MKNALSLAHNFFSEMLLYHLLYLDPTLTLQ